MLYHRFSTMLCQHLRNQTFWLRGTGFRTCQIKTISRSLSRIVGSPHRNNCHRGWRSQEILSVCFKSDSWATRIPLCGQFVPGSSQSRTICSTTSLSAASTGNIGSGFGWYESLSDSAPVNLAESMLISLHETSGMPWWANIICATVALRTTVTLPLSVYQMYILAKVENLQPEIDALAKRLRYEVSVYGNQHGWTDKVARFQFRKNLRRIISGLYVRDNCHPVKASLLIWIQIPMWIFVSIALRNISLNRTADTTGDAVQKQLTEGGLLWFPDLTVPDSTWVLPVTLGLLNLFIVEIFALRKIELSRFQKIITNFIRAISIAMIPIAATVPSSMALYWVTSSCVGLAHNLLLRSPALRRVCRIPRSKSDSDTPYKDILSAFVVKYFSKK
ncbi:cytochrome c oxidase assembly factor COX18r L homeolog isoform X2 [Xenopus laevis]|uniref:Cytochrome c oxidase assembly factor COX18r L homeolog isoform X2 n=1 Tax=Xenopus laevis TaxID=8355 RepID=A0A8J0UN64_XENLA|nr:cytochrome c oxidase assembly factor COX18r L homeolog isoform X2 [Xenopus laevis]